MRRAVLATSCVIMLGCMISGCGWLDRFTASATGWSRICVAGVSYIKFTSGASVEYSADGKLKTCN